MEKEKLSKLIEEIRDEQRIHPNFPDISLENFILEGEYDINRIAGKLIDYDVDLSARALLKNYVMYANHNRLAEFKEVYVSDYATLQIKYY